MKSEVGRARTDAGDGARVVPEVVGHLDRVILNRHVEVVEREDQDKVEHRVERGVVVERAEEVRPEAGAVGGHERLDGARDSPAARRRRMIGRTPTCSL